MGVLICLYAEIAYLGVLIMVDFIGILWIYALNGDIHVRLSSAQPHVANHHIIDNRSANGQLVRSARLLWCKGGTKMSVGISRYHRFLLVQPDAYLLSRLGIAPYYGGFVALHHHTILKELWQSHLCCTAHGDAQECKESSGKSSFHLSYSFLFFLLQTYIKKAMKTKKNMGLSRNETNDVVLCDTIK